MRAAHAVWIAVPILWAMMCTSESGNELDLLRDLQWMSRATVTQVKAQIEAGADPLKPAAPLRPGVDKHPGHTPLHFAAQANPDPTVSALFIGLGADLEARSSLADGGTPLHLAAGGWGIRRAELLLMGRNSIGTVGLREIVNGLHKLEQIGKLTGNSLHVIEILLDTGANINSVDDWGASPLHRAAAVASNPDTVDLLLSRGAKLDAVDSRGWTPLHMAALSNMTPEVVQYLLDNGADFTAPSNQGGTPLHFASESVNLRVLSTLLRAGSYVDARDKENMTPLHVAARNPIPAFARVLLDHGADLESKDIRGRTPLHWSLWSNDNPGISILLIERGADVNSRDDEGKLPMEIVMSNTHIRRNLRGWSEELYGRLIELLYRATAVPTKP